MSILTDNKITRTASGAYQHRGKLIILTSAFLLGVMAYDKIKPLDTCELAALDLKNVHRTSAETPEETTYIDSRIAQTTSFIEANCPKPPNV